MPNTQTATNFVHTDEPFTAAKFNTFEGSDKLNRSLGNSFFSGEARQAALRAYAPYSNFRVGAVAVDSEGQIYYGSNVENAAYGSTICAEANAISNAVDRGARRIAGIAVACVDATDVNDAYPCGNCRQMMNEFGVEWVLVTTDGTEIRRHDFSEILPYGFSL